MERPAVDVVVTNVVVSFKANELSVDDVESLLTFSNNNHIGELVEIRCEFVELFFGIAHLVRAVVIDPHATIIQPYISSMLVIVKNGLDHQIFVVALDSMEPRFVDELSTLKAVGTSVNQISNGEQAINFHIEFDRLESEQEVLAATVKITYDEISALSVGFEALHFIHGFI